MVRRGFRQRKIFRWRQRSNSLWRHSESRQQWQGRHRSSGGRRGDQRSRCIEGTRRENNGRQVGDQENRQDRTPCGQKQSAGKKGPEIIMATAAKETSIKPVAAAQVTFLEAIEQAMYEGIER